MLKLARKKWLVVAAGVIAVAILFIALRPVFSGEVILPQDFQLGPVALHYYGLILALAVASAYGLAVRRARPYGLQQVQVDRLVFIVVIAGFLGARLYHVLTEFSYYANYPEQILAVWQGGLSIFGALLGGALGLWLARRWYVRDHSLLALLDWLAPSFLLGQIIGRFGNLFNYEIFGPPTSLPWKMFVPVEFRPGELINVTYFHPLFLYEILCNTLVLVILWRLTRKNLRPGTLFFSYLFLYNAGRFFLEWYRLDNVYLSVVPLNTIVALVLAIVSMLAIYRLITYDSIQPPHS